MKKTFLILAFILTAAAAWTQSPEKMSYQAIIRDANGNLVTNQNIGVKISVLQGDDIATSQPVYTETHTITSNPNGLVTFEIGNGNIVTGVFSDIDWSVGNFYIKTETDITGGNDYSIAGTSQLLSVPYALYAKTAEHVLNTDPETDPVYSASEAAGITAGNIADWNAKLSTEIDGSVSNELQIISISNDTIYLTDGGFAKLPSASTFSGSYTDLTDIPANLDADVTDDFNGDFSNLTNVPAGLSDGDDDTQLTESQVDTYVSNNGYLTSEVDGSITNEIELPTQTSHSGHYLSTDGTSPQWKNISFAELSSIPAGLSDGDDDTQLTESQVDSYVGNNGYLISEVDGSITNEIELPTQNNHSGHYLTTNGVYPSWVDSKPSVVTVTANTTLTNSNKIVFINGPYVVSFPASPTDGMELTICAINGSATVNANGSTLYLANSNFTSLSFSSAATNMYVFYYSSSLNVWIGTY